MNLTFTLCVGDKSWGQKALNWCLSVKHSMPKAKTALIYTASAIEGIETEVERFFDYTYRLMDSEITNPIELSFKTKTELYDIATTIADAEAYLFMDADTIMLSGRSVDEFFTELKDVDFTMWCNDVYDFATKTRMRDDYTFWCEPEEAKKAWSLIVGKMPQVNSSFIYFKKNKISENLFHTANHLWSLDFDYKKYKGVKPDELCFNMAFATLDILPHQIPYYPIFFSFAFCNFEEQYIRNWKAIGFAGDKKQHPEVIQLYYDNVVYFREFFDVAPFTIDLAEERKPKDKNKLSVKYEKRRTIFRQGELANSDGGIFNPDAIITSTGELMTIVRKEVNHDAFKNVYSESTAVPFVYFNESNYYDLKCVNYPDGLRIEDFRLFKVGEDIWCNHKLILKVTLNVTDMKTCLGKVKGDELICFGIPELPVKMTRMDINWGLFSEDNIVFCIYSLCPYKLFYSFDGLKTWDYFPVSDKKIDWFHKDQFICNSTNPILIDDYYLIFFHTKEMSTYFHGACLIDKSTKEIVYATPNSLNIEPTQSGREKGLLYVSGSVYLQQSNSIRLFFGDCDSHAAYVEYDCSLLIKEIMKYPV